MAVTPADVRARAETDLADPALQKLIDDAVSEIVQRHGPAGQVVVELDGSGRLLDLVRPVGAGAVTISERASDGTSVALAADDWRSMHGGRTLERLGDGTNPAARWAGRVTVTYTPVDDAARRDEVTVKLAVLALNYEGVQSRTVGDVQTRHADYAAEREKLVASLSPRPGLLLA